MMPAHLNPPIPNKNKFSLILQDLHRWKLWAAFPPALVIFAILFSQVVFLWFDTEGTWNPLLPHSNGFIQYYDYQADSLLQGRLDVPRDAIWGDAFVVNGKYYGYFGIAPALLRIPLNIIFPSMWGRWSILFLWLGSTANLLVAYYLFREISGLLALSDPADPAASSKRRDLFIALLILVLGLGSTNIFLSASASVYHEAIVLGCAFCLLTCLVWIKFFRSPSIWKFLWILIFGFFTVFSRVTFGVYVLLLVGFLLVFFVVQKWRPQVKMIPLKESQLWPYIAGFLLFILFTIGLYGLINQLKFGSPFESHPYQYYPNVLNDPVRYARTVGQDFFVQNIPMMASLYFFPVDVQFLHNFPPFLSNRVDPSRFPATHWDWFEPIVPLPFCMTLELLLAGVGLFSLYKHRRSLILLIPIISTAAAFPMMFMFNSASQRYEQEFFPFLVLTNILGFLFISGVTQNRNSPLPAKDPPPVGHSKFVNGLKKLVIVVLLAAGIFSIYQSLAITYSGQMNSGFLVDAHRRLELKSITQNIDHQMSLFKKDVKNILLPQHKV